MDFEKFKLDRDEKIFTASVASVIFAFLDLIYSFANNAFGRPEADKIGR